MFLSLQETLPWWKAAIKWVLQMSPIKGSDFSLRAAILAPAAMGFIILTILEMVFPWRRPVFGRHNVHTAFYYVLGRKLAIWLFFITPLVNATWRVLHLPSLDLDHRLSPLGAFAVALLALTFASYWSHRLLHTVPFFWHMHKVHHAPAHLYWGIHFHEHFAAKIVGGPMLAVLLRLLGMSVPATVGAVVVLIDAFEHSNIRVRLGWLNYILILPEVHRFHHSVDPRHYKTNYGVVLTLWDILFGTFYYDPRAVQTLRFGLDEPMPPDFFRQQAYPLGHMAKHAWSGISAARTRKPGDALHVDDLGQLPGPALPDHHEAPTVGEDVEVRMRVGKLVRRDREEGGA